jgi:NodT family efflux transporter outer membrane factor (OMF) lipoprotein
MVGPRYVRPAAPLTPTYKESPPQAYASDSVWNPARPGDASSHGQWWKLFGDEHLNALEQQVDARNLELRSAEARFRIARALVGYARADEFPTIAVAPGISSLRDSPREPYFPSPNAPATADFLLPIDVSYEIDLWGRIRRSVAASGEKAQASAADLETVNLSLHAELAIDYFQLRSADTQQRLLDDTVKAYADSLQLTQDRLDGGASPASDVAQAKTQLDAARVQATDIGVLRAQYEHAIAVLAGQPPASFTLAAAPLDLQPPVLPVGIPSELLQRRPDIAAAERRAAAANEKIGIALAAYYPSLSLNGIAGFESSALSTWLSWPSRLWAVGLSMEETVYDGGRRHAKTELARAQYDAAIAEYQQTALTAFKQVEDSLAELRILEREAEQQDETVDSARDSLRIFTDRYVGGRDNYLQVITAQTAYLDSERQQVEIRRRRLDASVVLIKALGGGWDASVLPRLDELIHPTRASSNAKPLPGRTSPQDHSHPADGGPDEGLYLR